MSASHLLEVCAHLHGKMQLPICRNDLTALPIMPALENLADVKGQGTAKRALEIAAAGQHSLLYLGPPGTGKTMLASRLPSILPPIAEDKALEIAAVASISSSGFNPDHWRQIPFRSPHHSSSSAALVGGGCPPRPGEISLANHGVLFLDELPEFSRHVLESLREPLESGHITISRAAHQTIFPAQFQLIASMNPCPCGYAGSSKRHCRCNDEQVKRYLSKISGPLLDRIDMQVEVGPVSSEQLAANESQAETSEVVKQRVIMAHQKQYARQQKPNALLTVPELTQWAQLTPAANSLIDEIMNKFSFSARVYHRLLKVALTLSDLSDAAIITEQHIAEVLSYRCLDRLGMCKI